MLGLAAVVFALATPSTMLVPQVAPNQVLQFQTRRRITGPFDHTIVSNTTVRILPQPIDSQPNLRFSVDAVTEGHKTTREFRENTDTLTLLSGDGPVTEGIAPLGYTAQMFGTPPAVLSVGAKWSGAVVQSTFGDRGTVQVVVTSVDEKSRRCVLDVSFAGSWSQMGQVETQMVSGTIRRRSHGAVTIQNGIITERRLKGEERQTYPGGAPSDSFFDLTRVLVSK